MVGKGEPIGHAKVAVRGEARNPAPLLKHEVQSRSESNRSPMNSDDRTAVRPRVCGRSFQTLEDIGETQTESPCTPCSISKSLQAVTVGFQRLNKLNEDYKVQKWLLTGPAPCPPCSVSVVARRRLRNFLAATSPKHTRDPVWMYVQTS